MNKPRHILLQAHLSGAVRFLSGLHVNLEEGKTSSWVTLTRTGKFTDPRYGEFEISKSMLLSMVSNFDKGVYGQDVFIDVAHKPDNGAAAKVLKVTVEGDRLRALCEWTPYGLDAIKNKGYRYLSLEYHEQWRDNEQQANHGPTMLGAGLVVRPCIKRLDPIQLSEAEEDGPVLIHPELKSTLLQELETMHKNALAALKAKLQAKKLAAAVVDTIMLAAEKAVADTTDEAQAAILLNALDSQAIALGEAISANSNVSITLPASQGLNLEDVRKLLSEEAARQAGEAKKLQEQLAGNVKLLTELIGAETSLDDGTKKDLSERATALITPNMTEDQVKQLAAMQVENGRQLNIARQLSGLGYVAPNGQVHQIQVPFEDSRKLGEIYQDRMKATSFYAQGKLRLSKKDNLFINRVLAEFDRLHNGQIADEVKMLSGGAVNISNTNLPVGFRREVIREALSDLRVLDLVQTLTDFSATVTTQIPYELRDTSQIVNDGIVFEGQPIPNGGIGQFMDTAYILPTKLALLISNEALHFTQAAAINWDAMARNVESNARIMRELICRRIMNELQRASDSFGAVAIAAESFTAQLNGAVSQIKTVNFPIVRQFQQRDLQGTAVGSAANPITIVLNSAPCLPYDGTNTQAAGTYYRVNSYNLGYVQFVNQLGAAVTPANTGTNTVVYSRATNVAKVDLDIAAGLTYEKQLNKILQGIGSRKAMLSSQRFIEPDYLLMSPVMNDMATNAEQFALQNKRDGTDTSADGDLERVKGLPSFSSNAPGVDMGDERILIGQRGQLGYTISKPFVTGQPFEALDASGRPIGKKQAYGEEYSAIKVPAPVAGRMTSLLVFSFTGR